MIIKNFTRKGALWRFSKFKIIFIKLAFNGVFRNARFFQTMFAAHFESRVRFYYVEYDSIVLGRVKDLHYQP